MSLLALPVSASDLTQLQLGIEFFTNAPEAANEATLINVVPSQDTVDNYANTLLARNISLSQVAMAVDSLMFGVTDTTAELGKLATQYLPAQVANALANGFNPTVYAAEALGLALAGGNGSSTKFAANFGSLSVSQFAEEVGTLTGINVSAIRGFVQNWINFYTANPSATFGLSVTLASYGAAFGDAVGIALANPTVNGTVALLVSDVQNALIDNGEGGYQAGIALSAEPPHRPLQGEALLISNAGGPPIGPTLDFAPYQAAFDYVQFNTPAQSAAFTIKNAPSIFTLNTQHFGTNNIEIDPAANLGNLLTLILGDNTASDSLGTVITGYRTVDIVVANPSGATIGVIGFIPGDMVISGIGTLTLGGSVTPKIDASNAPRLVMNGPDILIPSFIGVTVLGGEQGNNILQGSVGSQPSTVTFSNGNGGVAHTDFVGADNFTAGSGGNDDIFGDGGPDTITLANHSRPDTVFFGRDNMGQASDILAITDGMDVAYPGFWGASATKTTIPNLFPGTTGGTSADMTTITGFDAGLGADVLSFQLAAWNGASTALSFAVQGDLVNLSGLVVVPAGNAQLSAVWVNSGSNGALKTSDDVLRYAPSDASLQNAQQLATQLHSSDAVVLPGVIPPGADVHILVAYAAGNNAVNIADVDLANTGTTTQKSTANVNVYASDMVHLTGVSLTSLTPDNIHFA
jgi:hypothetical protein